MIKQTLTTLQQTWQHHRALQKLYHDGFKLDHVNQLTPYHLQKLGIQALALDFDGVLAPHGYNQPQKNVRLWLDHMIGSVGFDHIFILTNKPISQRRSFFAFYYPSIKFISGVAKKPSPEGLLTISEKANVAPSQIALIDDRLLLGCLACIRAGCIPIWIKQPLKDYHTSPFKEAFFDIMRFSDRLLVR